MGGPGDPLSKRNPYARDTKINQSHNTYLADTYGEGYDERDANYAYKYSPNKDFIKGFTNAGETGSYGGDPNQVMFTMTSGRQAQRGKYNEKLGAYNFSMPSTAQGRNVTVGEYQANPGAYDYAVEGNTQRFNNYLNPAKKPQMKTRPDAAGSFSVGG